MKRIFRSLAALLAAFVMLAALTTATVGATGEEPLNPHWEGTTARWKAPALDVTNYTVMLFADYNNLVVTVSTSNDFYDFSSVVENYNAETFAFNICANYDSGSSDFVGSADIYTKPVKTTHEHPLHWVEYKAPTCTEKGVEEHFECTVCKRYFWDSNGTDEIDNPGDTVIPATGHKWGEWQTTKKATAAAEGEAKRVCQNDSSHVETKKLPKLPAESTAATQPATAAPTTVPPATVPATTTPGTTAALVTTGTLPATQPTTPAATEPSAIERTVLGLSLGTFIMLAVIAGLVFVVLPAVLIPVLLSRRKKMGEIPPEPAEKPQKPGNPSDFNDGFNG